MHMQDIRAIARDLGVKTGRSTKADLVRTIQRAEGNFDCFASADQGVCDQADCLWRQDCLREARRSAR
jgi:hypothetical protein